MSYLQVTTHAQDAKRKDNIPSEFPHKLVAVLLGGLRDIIMQNVINIFVITQIYVDIPKPLKENR